jgi:hypothetical protein
MAKPALDLQTYLEQRARDGGRVSEEGSEQAKPTPASGEHVVRQDGISRPASDPECRKG